MVVAIRVAIRVVIIDYSAKAVFIIKSGPPSLFQIYSPAISGGVVAFMFLSSRKTENPEDFTG